MIGLLVIAVVVAGIAFGVHEVAGSLTGPLGILLLVVAGLVLIAVVSLAVKARDLLEEYGAWILVQMAFWHHLGLPYHGDPVTNATWHYHGTRALTETGNARRCYYWPRKRLVAVRCTRSAVVLAALYGLAAYTRVTAWLLVAAGLGLAWYLGRRFWTWAGEAAHHREVTAPLHQAAHDIAGVPLSYKPRGWIEVDRDRTRAVLHLPASYNPEERKDSKLVEAVAVKVGIEDPLVKWKLAGTEPQLIVSESPHPPAQVALRDILPQISAAPWDTFVLGLGRPHAGRRVAVSASLASDSPHLAMSMGSGGGKTVLERLRIAQWCMKGGVAFILNPKRQGYQWAKDLPNVVVAETPEQIFYLLVWLGEQLDKRNELASTHADIDDKVPDGMVGAPWLVVVEEMNLLIGRQIKYWKRNKLAAALSIGLDPEEGPLPKDSPALESLDDLAFAGRQSEMFVDFIGQRLSSKVISGDVLENCGVRLLGRWSDRVKSMLAPEYSLPRSSTHPGRIAVVASGKVRECQVAYATPAECRAMAQLGTAAYPDTVPTASITRLPESLGSESGDTGTASSALPSSIGMGSGLVTLSKAVSLGYTAGKSLEAVRGDRKRYRSSFPVPRERHWNTDYYVADEIIEFYETVDSVSKGKVGSPV